MQSSPSFPQSPRGHNIAHRYLDDGHPLTYGQFDNHNFNYDPTQVVAPSGNSEMSDQSDSQMSVSNDYSYYVGFIPPMEQEQEIEEELIQQTQQQQSHRSTARRKSTQAPRALSSSILPTRRRRSQQMEVEGSSNLLTFDEEVEITGHIQNFQLVSRARDNLLEWMSRELGNQQGSEPSEYQWASACSLSVDQLHEVMSSGHEAKTRLIKGNVGLVTSIAKRYYNMLRNSGMGSPNGGGAGGTDATLKLDDLIQEGYMGIMEAAERFDATKGFRFSTYATHWIRQRIIRSIAESSRTIRLPVHVQTMLRNMHKTNKILEAQIGRTPSMPELAHEMGVPLDKIDMYQHLSKNVLSLELPVDRHSNTEDKRTLGDRVAQTEMATPDESFMSESLRGEVHAMLDALGHDERLVLTHRYGLDDGRPKSLRETAEGMGLSSDIIRRVEAKALTKLRQPRMNYKVKEYIGGVEATFSSDSDYAAHYSNGMLNGMNNMYNMEVQQEEEQQQYHTQNPHHNINGARYNANGEEGSNDLEEYERPTPESIWGF